MLINLVLASNTGFPSAYLETLATHAFDERKTNTQYSNWTIHEIVNRPDAPALLLDKLSRHEKTDKRSLELIKKNKNCSVITERYINEKFKYMK